MVKKKRTGAAGVFSEDFIKKASRLLKGETLELEQLEKYKYTCGGKE